MSLRKSVLGLTVTIIFLLSIAQLMNGVLTTIPSREDKGIAILNKPESVDSYYCTALGYDGFCSLTTGKVLGPGDTISWSFSGSNTYVGINVWAIDDYNYVSFAYDRSGNGYQLDTGNYYANSGTWSVQYTDTNWHIVFWNLDSDSFLSGYTTDLTIDVTGNDHTPPYLTITSPTSGALVHGTITIAASASDNNGIALIQAKIDSAGSFVSTTGPPYSWTWDTTQATNGAHTIYVEAYDPTGNSWSTTLPVVVDNLAPTVSITSPSNVAIVTGTITISASASDTNGISYTQARIDSGSWTTDSTSPYSWTWNTVAETEGTHSITVQAFDMVGNQQTVSISVTVDNSAPTLAITSPTNGALVSGTITIAATTSDVGGIAYVEYNVDGGGWVTDYTGPYSWNLDTTTLSTGPHTINVRSYDTIGNYNSASVSITVDNTNPTISITSPTNGALVRGTITVSATASDTYGIAYVEYNVDGSAWITDSSAPYSWNLDTTSLSVGSHTINFRAYDTAGNFISNYVTINVDNQVPAVSITAPTQGALLHGLVTISATASDNIAVSYLQYKIDTGSYISDPSAPYSWNLDTISLSNGQHTLYVQAIDTAGNSQTVSITITVDNQAPSISITNPAQGATVSGSITISASASDNVGISYVQYRIDSGTWTTDNSAPYTWTWDTTTVTNNAQHTIYVQAVDTAGNTQTASITITVSQPDTTPPTVTILSPSPGETLRGGAIISASASDASGIAYVQYKIDSGAWITDTSAPYSWGWDTTTVPDGQYTIYVQAVDNAGNTQTVSVTVYVSQPDIIPPDVTITNPNQGDTVSGTVTISVSASDASGISYVQYNIDGGSFIADYSTPYEFSWDTTSYANGQHVIYVEAVDNAGNTQGTSITVTISQPDTTPPTVSITSPIQGDLVKNMITITVTALDASGISYVQYNIDGGSWTTDSSDPYSWSFDTTTLADGSHTINVQAFDTLDNSQTVSITITVDNTAPSVIITNPVSGNTYSGTITISATASDTNGVSYVEFNIDDGSWITDSSDPYSWSFDTTTLSDGSHTINMQAIDSLGNTRAVFLTFKVNNQPNADTELPIVSITSPSDGDTVSGIITITASANDNVGVSYVEYSLDGISWTSDYSGPYSWSFDTTLVTDGTYTITVRAYDAAGNSASDAITVVISNIPDTTVPPSSSNPPPTSSNPPQSSSNPSSTSPPTTKSTQPNISGSSPGFEMISVLIALIMSFAFLRRKIRKN